MDYYSLLRSLLPTSEAIYIAAYAYGVLIGAISIYAVVGRMWQILRVEAAIKRPNLASYASEALETYPWQGIAVGVAERALYIASLQAGRGELIAVWLILKTVARSRSWTQEASVPGRAIYSNFDNAS
jgi:hypothetical protein